MPSFLKSSDADLLKKLDTILSQKGESNTEVNTAVAAIISDVEKRGDAAVTEYTERFDKHRLPLAISHDEIERAVKEVPSETRKALEFAAARITAYHEKQKPADLRYTDEVGVTLGWKWTPIDAAGLYVPGGQAAYPSSVLMNAIPAKIAGVKRLAMVVPTPAGVLNPLVLLAAKISGVTEIYRIGGAQAIAALAYGTATIKPVNKIVGPGNAYVAAAKRLVFGKVGIDMIAGPSEILVIADSSANPNWIAADLLSQAEHDADARSILITDDEVLAKKVEAAVEATLQTLSRQTIARKSWDANGVIVTVRSLAEAAEISNRIAPEHLELMVKDPAALEPKLVNAGAIFLGHYTPEAIGDYSAGPSHVLPTSGSAAFSSGLGVVDFLKRSSIIGCSADGFAALQRETASLADAEGLSAHALSVRIRSNQ